jgi:DNA-binding GntR family transcriptional regulator
MQNSSPATLLRIETAPDLVDQVYRALLDAICDGSLAPGQRITQEDVAARLAVSRQPVLQALRLLKKDGFVRDASEVAGAGVRGLLVTPLDGEWIARVYEVRGALDALAARRAAEQHFVVPPELLAQGHAAIVGQDIRAMIEADLAFHSAIYQASGNPLIGQSALLHWRHIRLAMGESLQAAPQRGLVWDEHDAIAQAMAEGQADLAERLMTDHASRAATKLGEHLAARAAASAAAFSKASGIVHSVVSS